MDRSTATDPGRPSASGEPISLAQAGAVLTIDLAAIRSNYRMLKARLAGTACAGVVKADGYGLGAASVAFALMAEGCDTFFVAHVREGVVLREAIGPAPTVYILNGLPPGSEQVCEASGLIPVLNSRGQLHAWHARAKASGRVLPAAVQVDSGMSRLGMAPDEVDAIRADPHAFDAINLRLVMSHLACADDPSAAANEAQRRDFETLAEKLPKAPRSFANSSGIFLGPAYHYDLARPGAALYGLNPTPGLPNPMDQVVRLEAKIIQTRRVPAGTGIGYGHFAHAPHDMDIATIALGYADGWPRRAAPGAWFDGVAMPFVGRVSMDSIILDASTLPPEAFKPGDRVELIGDHRTIDDLAAEAGTIGYEILTGLGHRFHRIYMETGLVEGLP